MKYRDAKHLKAGDQVKMMNQNSFLIVSDIEILWSINVVRINCIDSKNNKIVIYNEDIQ